MTNYQIQESDCNMSVVVLMAEAHLAAPYPLPALGLTSTEIELIIII